MNDWLWILPVLYFVLTAIGGAASKKAKEASGKSRERRQRTTMEPMGEAGGAAPEVAADPAPPEPSPRQKTADEIAAEIRRMMGLPVEPVARPVEVVEEYYEDEPAEAMEEETMQPELLRSHGGDLRERLAQRESEGRHSAGVLENRHLAEQHSSLTSRHLGSAITSRGPVGSLEPVRQAVRRTREGEVARGYVDLRDMARALVTAEILGPPKALRQDEW